MRNRCVLTLLLLASSNVAFAQVADLKSNWSDASNPNTVSYGSWTYRSGPTVLPHVPDWTPLGATPAQPAWAPGVSPPFLPALFKATSAPAGVDWQVGDVVTHTTDPANGGSNGPANFLWTSPENGFVSVTGGVWMGRDIGRGNDWKLYRNDTLLTSGHVESDDIYSRANPFSLDAGTGGVPAVTNIPVNIGDTLMLELVRTTASGDFVGLNFTITAVPEPSLAVILILGLLTRSIAVGRRARVVVCRPSSGSGR